MPKTIALIGSLDTKGAEYRFVQERIQVRREVFPYFDDAGRVTRKDLLVDLAPYLFRGRLGGYLTRLSATGLANVTSGGGQVPSGLYQNGTKSSAPWMQWRTIAGSVARSNSPVVVNRSMDIIARWTVRSAGYALDLLEWGARVTLVTNGNTFEGDESQRVDVGRRRDRLAGRLFG